MPRDMPRDIGGTRMHYVILCWNPPEDLDDAVVRDMREALEEVLDQESRWHSRFAGVYFVE